MTIVLFKIFLILLLVVANGFFVAVEFALVSVRRARIETLATAGTAGAAAVLRALDHLDEMLSASQFGITLASLALGAVGESTLAGWLEPFLLPRDVLVGGDLQVHALGFRAKFEISYCSNPAVLRTATMRSKCRDCMSASTGWIAPFFTQAARGVRSSIVRQ